MGSKGCLSESTIGNRQSAIKMIGVRLHGPRDLRVDKLSEPKPPGPHQVLVRVEATGICGSDLHTYLDAKIGDTVLKSPLILGHEFAGTVEQIGDSVTDVRVGMRVAVDPAQPCGACELCLRGHPNLCTSLHFCGLYPDHGCLCERIIVPEKTCVPLPDSFDAETGALLEPLGVAIHAVGLSKAGSGESAVIIGAGPIGLLILQVAKAAGMNPIYVVEQLPWRLHLAEKLGGIAIDSGRVDPREKIMVATLGRGVDVVFEVAWADQSIQLAAEVSRPGGKLILVGIPRGDELAMHHSTARRKGLTILLSRRMKHTYSRAISLVEDGKVDVKCLVSHRFPLNQTPAAFEMNADYRDHVVKVMILPNERPS
jgi:L-iditol 2-dehydrogenase